MRDLAITRFKLRPLTNMDGCAHTQKLGECFECAVGLSFQRRPFENTIPPGEQTTERVNQEHLYVNQRRPKTKNTYTHSVLFFLSFSFYCFRFILSRSVYSSSKASAWVFFFFSFLGKARFRNVDAFLSPACYYLSFPKSRFKIAIDKSGKRRWCQNKHSEFPALPSEVNVKFCATVASREPRPPTEDKAIVLAFLRRWTQIANECYVSARLRVKLEPNVDAIIVSNLWPAFAFADDVISISRSAVRFCYLGGVGRAAAAHRFA